MFYKLLESIKGEKTLSFNHWRYRVLHWTFGISPKTQHESSLPDFLYTHYCPLFHLTNMLAILLPITFCIKMIIATFLFSYHAASTILEESAKFSFKVEKAIGKAFPKKVKTASVEENLPPGEFGEGDDLPVYEKTPEQLAREKEKKKRSERALLLKTIRDIFNDESDHPYLTEFSRFFNKISYKYDALTKDEIEAIWAKETTRLREADARAKARKENMRQKIIFWVNFSQIFIKAIFNIAYFALFLAVAYVSVFYLAPFLLWAGKELLEVLWQLATVDWLRVVKTLAFVLVNLLIFSAVGAVLIFFITKLIAKMNARESDGKTKEKVTQVFAAAVFPVVALKDMALGFFKWVKGGIECCVEFVYMFYEESCPPISIVNEPEEELVTEE